MESITKHCVKYLNTKIYIHDDSTTEKLRLVVDKTVKYLNNKYNQDIVILRRSEQLGGKPGAVNHIIQKIPSDVEYILLCDSDSFFLETDFLARSLIYFENPKIALVQFRNIGYLLQEDKFGYKILAESITFYDAFVYFMDRFGWSPFLGHNAILRVSSIKEVGGFTPGQLADDIDFSVKLRLHGYQIKYDREIACGERHPLTYEALRLRTQKWTYGCTQILLRLGGSILRSQKISILEKLTFFLTVSYYHFQILLFIYLCIFYILLPFKDPAMGGRINLMVSAGLILLLTFLPSITYFSREGRFMQWPRSSIYWGFTYGSQDFVMIRAVFHCLLKKRVAWIPTHASIRKFRTFHFLPEIVFGVLIVVVALLQNKTLLLLPTTILFAGKFMITPFLNRLFFHKNARSV